MNNFWWIFALLSGLGLAGRNVLMKTATGKTDPALAAMVLPPPAAVWAEQSCRVVTRPDFYPRRAKLDQAYVDKHLPIAERQLRAGGVALAAVLNKALGGR